MDTHKKTPMMLQWEACKQSAQGALLLFRMGDFYEAFHEDAVEIAKVLQLTLTKRQEVPMCGVPAHTCEAYVDKLVSRGYRVAIAEQTEDPKQTKGLVKREVTRTLSPGTVMSSSLLEESSHNFFASVVQVGQVFAAAFLDITTAEFIVSEFASIDALLDQCVRMGASEYLASERLHQSAPALFRELNLSSNVVINIEEGWKFDLKLTQNTLLEHFGVATLQGFGIESENASIVAAGSLIHHIKVILNLSLDHVKTLQSITRRQFMQIDRRTQVNLKLTQGSFDSKKSETLLGVIDHTLTPMGGRLLKQWLRHPLLDVQAIEQRQQGVVDLVRQKSVLEYFSSLLHQIRDLERLAMKLGTAYATPKDLIALKSSLEPVHAFQRCLKELLSDYLIELVDGLDPLPDVIHLIRRSIVDEPPLRLSDGGVIREGYHSELDELRQIQQGGKTWVINYQEKLQAETGIKTLKVRFNKMFGYYIEVSRGQVERVPAFFQRRQTLVNAERYITPELKQFEEKVLTAEERISSLELALFKSIKEDISKWSDAMLSTARSLAVIDVLCAFAVVAIKQKFCCPKMHQEYALSIKKGRHPVVEATHFEESFVPNDTELNSQDCQMMLITGPNMAGKSTYIRQVALIQILAQIGSFVPADVASLGIVDQVFTRIGASDDLSRGQSTFMVEMAETANILNHATERSLVILDEIGRGTSTYDGIAIAWSVAEHLLVEEGKRAKTLFATHYFELTQLENLFSGAKNYNIAVHERDDGIQFLRKIVKGGTDRSYGIHVARLAGVPLQVIERAKEILAHLEENGNRKGIFEPKRIHPKKAALPVGVQMTFFGEG